MNTKVNKLSKIKRLKRHIRENRAVYIGTATGFVAGVIGGVFAFTRRPVTAEEFHEAMKLHVQTLIKGGRRNTTNVYQTISMYGNVIGRPGKRVLNEITGKVFESETLAARAAGVSLPMMSNHLNGKTGPIKGDTFRFVD